MKSLFTALFTALFTILPAQQARASGGQGHGNGGDTLVAQFVGTAANLVDSLKLLEAASQGCSGISSAELNVIIDSALVESVPVLFEENGERDAWNYPSLKKIILSRSRLHPGIELVAYVNLVLHEYLGLLGKERTNDFHLSGACVSHFRQMRIDLGKILFSPSKFSTVETGLASGLNFLSCEGGGQKYRFQAGDWFRFLSNHLFERIGKDFDAFDDLSTMSVIPQYDLATGRYSYVATQWQSHLGAVKRWRETVNVESTDHIHWNGWLTFGETSWGRIRYPAVPLKCVILY